ncbi:hypothetical protein T01_9662 [Trichinella spiralis]|uniref:Peptidase aspartic putative domain-containing protein n=1 Tax=Trichinella spiralis TaxID=6334 RepID=A0A0V1BV33_TRISP|nr:hypothetical protein T01_9662 [Trichinella spiralis]
MLLPLRASLLLVVNSMDFTSSGCDNYYYEFVTGRIRRATNGSLAVENRLGWIVCGRSDPRRFTEARVFLMKVEDHDDTILRKFWESELLVRYIDIKTRSSVDTVYSKQIIVSQR